MIDFIRKAITIDESPELEYVMIEEVCKISSNIQTTYFQGSVINPKSLVTFEKWENDDFKIGNKVSFKLRDSLKEFLGSIRFIGKANGIPSSGVELV